MLDGLRDNCGYTARGGHAMVDLFHDALFTPTDVSHHLVIPHRTVTSWLSDSAPGGPLVHRVPAERRGAANVTFIALVEAYVLRALRTELRFSKRRIREAVEAVRRELDTPYALASQRIATDGIDIFVHYSDDEFARVGDHQMPVREFIADYLRFIDWGGTDHATRLRLRQFADDTPVIIDPRFNWGSPVVERTKTPVKAVVDLFTAGEPIDVVAEEYGLREEEVEAICRAELLRAEILTAA
ncbi:DUF433 domain-containing protein [Nocardia sp. CDC159]|uniref:DUF433 domain-containing protein n=1 Tax=Nocardia pulmonis TaxID=2951408 RepID=A0A9X2E700_9NOCA|nr:MULTISPECIES: DUF433 domain-containing protein [Nocardia]MCM6774949.1 DUF433 domain-containing protein [Nocardia pulmonis]MCM6789880.1 DUF433 domain-containing protein [Nocardia sp. CDC159]